jgi:acetyl esterase/lipase
MPSLRARLVRSWIRLAIKRRLQRAKEIVPLRRQLDRLSLLRAVPRVVRRESAPIEHIPAEWFIPPHPAGTMLYLHGGGYHFGSIRLYRELAARLAVACGARVLLPEYRLAPEHPFPAAVDDALLVYRRLLEEGHAPERIVVAGDSAGGGLSLALALALKAAGEPLPAALVCLSPWTDLTCAGETMTTCADLDAMLPADVVRHYAVSYAAGCDVRDPLISPLYGDLSGLPPLLVQVGTDEVLLSDSLRLAERARAAGTSVQLDVWPEMWHVWHLFATAVPEARQAIDAIGRFVAAAWTPPSRRPDNPVRQLAR